MLPLLLSLVYAHDLRVDVLDVGQGDSILIRDAQKVVLIDAGDDPHDVARQLAAEHVDHIDLVVATHPHADHVGGMLDVVEKLPVANYVDNHQAHTTQTYANLIAAIHAKEATGLRYLLPGTVDQDDVVERVRIGPDATLTFLFPLDGERETGTRSDLNSNSVVARLDHGSDCFLFVGDAEEDTERALLNRGLAQCDILKVAHHGSEYATTPAFLAAVAPKIGLVSVGADNRYGHPGPHTMARLQAADVTVYRTDLQGRITLRSSGSGVTITTERAGEGSPMVDVTAEALPGALAEVPPVPSANPLALTRPAAPISPAVPESASVDAAPAAAAACPFPASRNSEVFHEDGCGNGEKISPTNLICYATREAAIAAGKRPAGCCRP